MWGKKCKRTVCFTLVVLLFVTLDTPKNVLLELLLGGGSMGPLRMIQLWSVDCVVLGLLLCRS